MNREIEHGGRPHADTLYLGAGFAQTFDESRFEHRRGVPAIAPNGDARSVLEYHLAESAAEGARIGFAEGRPDGAADIVFTQDARIELVRRDPTRKPLGIERDRSVFDGRHGPPPFVTRA